MADNQDEAAPLAPVVADKHDLEAPRKKHKSGAQKRRERAEREAAAGPNSQVIPRARRRGAPAFEPTQQQRHIVATLAGFRLTHREIAAVMLNPKTGRPIEESTLAKAFPEELANGKARLKTKIIARWGECLDVADPHARWRAVEWSLKHICGFTEDALNAGVAVNVSAGGGSGEEVRMQIEFINPKPRELEDGPMRDVSPEPKPRRSERRDYPLTAAPGPTIDVAPNKPTSVPSVGAANGPIMGRKRGWDWS